MNTHYVLDLLLNDLHIFLTSLQNSPLKWLFYPCFKLRIQRQKKHRYLAEAHTNSDSVKWYFWKNNWSLTHLHTPLCYLEQFPEPKLFLQDHDPENNVRWTNSWQICIFPGWPEGTFQAVENWQLLYSIIVNA